MGASSSPAMFLVMAPVTKTFTTPSRAARSRMSATVPALSIAGDVFGMQTTEVKPPRAAAAVPVAMVFLGRLARLAQMDVQINQARTNDFSPGIETLCVFRRGKIFADGGNFAVNDEHIRGGIKMICGINHPSAGQQQRIHRREHSRARLRRQAHGEM